MIHKTKNKIKIKHGKIHNKVLFVLVFSFILWILFLNSNFNPKPLNITHYRDNNKNFPNESQVPSIKYNIYMVDFTQNPAFKGETTTVRGYVLEFDEDLIQFVKSSGVEVQLIIDGILNPTYSGTTDSNGNFTIEMDVDYTFDLFTDLQVNATIIDPFYKTSCKNYIYLDVRAHIQFVTNNHQEKFLLQHQTDPGFNNYFFEGHLEYNNGNQVDDINLPIKIGFGSSQINNITTIAYGGFFSYYSWIPILNQNNRYIKISYDGSNPEISSASKTIPINVIDSFTIDFDDSIDTEVYDNTELIISGRVFITNNESYNIPSNDLSMILNFMGHQQDLSIDNNGRFSERFNIPVNQTGIYSASVTINRYLGNDIVPISNNIEITVRQQNIFDPTSPNYIPFDLIIIAIVIIVAFVGIFIFMRWRLNKVETEWKDANYKVLNGRLGNVNMLINTGRFKEAIAYLYKIYAQLSANKYNSEKITSQTTRDYAIQMVREYGANPAHIYPFIQNIESVLYGGASPTSKFLEIKKGFVELYNDLLGMNPPEF